MQNNPNQEIHTDYKKNDIFKPVNANQLAKSIHYDFVVTQDMFDTYVNKQGVSEGAVVDIGEVLRSTIDGRSGPIDDTRIPTPISMFIAANTTGYNLSFTGRLWGGILYWTPGKSDCVNVYSSYPYSVKSLAGGLNFWSTINAPVILDDFNVTWYGVCKIGCYTLKRDYNFTHSLSSGPQIVFGLAVGDTKKPTYTPVATGPTYFEPTILFANWMGDSSVTTEYTIKSDDTSIPGLFQSMWIATARYKNEILLKVYSSSGNDLFLYVISDYTANEFRFSNSDTGRVVSIHNDGSITWNYVGGYGGGGGDQPVIIYNLNVTEHLNPNKAYTERFNPNTADALKGLLSTMSESKTILRPNAKDFKTIPEDTGDPKLTWYSNTKSFQFRGARVLEYYSWFLISVNNLTDKAPEWISNNNSVVIDVDDLVEGIVYEVNIHVVKLPLKQYEATFNSTKYTCGMQLCPDEPVVPLPGTASPNNLPKASGWSVLFYHPSGESANLYYWGTSKKVSDPTNILYPRYTVCTNNVDPDSSDVQLYYSTNELGRASIQFVKLNGNVYVMRY